MKVWYALLCLFSPYYLLVQSNLGPRLTAIGNNSAAVPNVPALQANALALTSFVRPIVSLNHLKQLSNNKIGKHIIVVLTLLIDLFSGTGLTLNGRKLLSDTAIPRQANLNYAPQTTTSYAF